MTPEIQPVHTRGNCWRHDDHEQGAGKIGLSFRFPTQSTGLLLVRYIGFTTNALHSSLRKHTFARRAAARSKGASMPIVVIVPTETNEVVEITIGELSKQTDVHIETIRYYERIKILPKPPRTNGGRRIYNAAHLRILTFI